MKLLCESHRHLRASIAPPCHCRDLRSYDLGTIVCKQHREAHVLHSQTSCAVCCHAQVMVPARARCWRQPRATWRSALAWGIRACAPPRAEQRRSLPACRLKSGSACASRPFLDEHPSGLWVSRASRGAGALFGSLLSEELERVCFPPSLVEHWCPDL